MMKLQINRLKNWYKHRQTTLKKKRIYVRNKGIMRQYLFIFRFCLESIRGLHLFRKVTHTVTIYGSARFPEDHPYYQLARDTALSLAQAGFSVMTGAGPGIMEAGNRGAQEGGGVSLGCAIQLPMEQGENPYLHHSLTFRYFFTRKVMLTKYSCAFIAMPGGYGTLDELFEIATLIQTKRAINFPIVLMGTQYWQPLMDFLKQTCLQVGTISSEDLDLFYLTDCPEEAVTHIQKTLDKKILDYDD